MFVGRYFLAKAVVIFELTFPKTSFLSLLYISFIRSSCVNFSVPNVPTADDFTSPFFIKNSAFLQVTGT